MNQEFHKKRKEKEPIIFKYKHLEMICTNNIKAKLTQFDQERMEMIKDKKEKIQELREIENQRAKKKGKRGRKKLKGLDEEDNKESDEDMDDDEDSEGSAGGNKNNQTLNRTGSKVNIVSSKNIFDYDFDNNNNQEKQRVDTTGEMMATLTHFAKKSSFNIQKVSKKALIN